MPEIPVDPQLGLNFESPNLAESKAQKATKKRDELLEAVAASRLGTLEQRVARVLNHFPDTRDSDITLQLRYWELFEPEKYGGGLIHPETYRQLPTLTSLSRARAKIQNTYGLFLAVPEVRKQRGTIEKEEYEKTKGQRPATAKSYVFVDESGKTSPNLVIGSFWCLESMELFRLEGAIAGWKMHHSFRGELHYRTIDSDNLATYCDFVDFLGNHMSVFSFKALSIPRAGLKQIASAIEDLIYHLVVRGVEHDVTTGRAPLPRMLQLWKDLEEAGSDRLLTANLAERIGRTASEKFDSRLYVDHFEAVSSESSALLQIADLFSSSVARVLNTEGSGASAKDRFANHLLSAIGYSGNPGIDESVGDLAVHLVL